MNEAAAHTFAFGRFALCRTTRLLLRDGEPVKIGARALDLLLTLVERRDRVVAKNELLDVVWPDLVVEENNLQVQVSSLRKLLGPQGIATIPGRGYQFNLPLLGEISAPLTSPATAPLPKPTPGQLPQHLPALIGREHDLLALVDQIEQQPLVTLVSAGGMGKTVLALAAAQALSARWHDGARWVDLTAVRDPAQLPHAVAQAMGAALNHTEPALAQVIELLGQRAMLLVLDNCEHLVDAAAELVAALGAQAPEVRLLATSQELLNVPGETVYLLRALALPGADAQADEVAACAAVQLFVERAHAADPRFCWRAEQATAIADLCHQLDGMPLAIELAAARVRLLGVQGLRDRLGERFQLLKGGARTTLARHQTLHAAIAWSHALLSAPEQAVLRRVALFVGGFTLESAQAMAVDSELDAWGVLDALSGLVDKSLVVAGAGERPRYSLLESTRAFALERLSEAGETAQWLERHARTVLDLFVTANEACHGEHGQLATDDYLQRLQPELPNARAAQAWASGPAQDLGLAVGLAGVTAQVDWRIGRATEALAGVDPIARKLKQAPPGTIPVTAEAAFWTSYAALGSQGRLPRNERLEASEKAVARYRQLAMPRRLYQALYGRAWSLMIFRQHLADAEAIVPQMAALERPDWPARLRCLRPNVEFMLCCVQDRFEEGLVHLTRVEAVLKGETGEMSLLLVCRNNQVLSLASLGRYEEAVELAGLLLQSCNVQDSETEAFLRSHLVGSLIFLRRLDEADAALRLALPRWRRAGITTPRAGFIALLLAEQGHVSAAARVQAAAVQSMERSGVGAAPLVRRSLERIRALLANAACAPADIERWRREGEALDDAGIASAYLDATGSRTDGPGSPH